MRPLYVAGAHALRLVPVIEEGKTQLRQGCRRLRTGWRLESPVIPISRLGLRAGLGNVYITLCPSSIIGRCHRIFITSVTIEHSPGRVARPVAIPPFKKIM